MTDKKITDLPANSVTASTDLVPMVDISGNVTQKMTLTQLAAAVASYFAAGAVAGASLATDGVTDTQLDYPRWWQEIGRTTLAVAGDTITVSSLPARKVLTIICRVQDTGGTITGNMTFNGDTAANYAHRYFINGATAGTSVSQTSFGLPPAAVANPGIFMVRVNNIATDEKTVIGEAVIANTAGAANAPQSNLVVAKWVNTTDQISSITLTNTGTGDYAIGSEVIVLGHD